jgi:mRNA-degrading endonuclease toxin of MazEF toxin-antitoxin module
VGLPYHFEFEPGERARQPAAEESEANLPKASVVNVSQILTVDKADLKECTGKLSDAAADAVRDGLHMLLDRL